MLLLTVATCGPYHVENWDPLRETRNTPELSALKLMMLPPENYTSPTGKPLLPFPCLTYTCVEGASQGSTDDQLRQFKSGACGTRLCAGCPECYEPGRSPGVVLMHPGKRPRAPCKYIVGHEPPIGGGGGTWGVLSYGGPLWLAGGCTLN